MSTKLKMTSKFTRLLTNLPFNPSLIGKVSFYSRRLRQESSIRRLGLVFIALAMIVQTIAVISPPRSSISASPGNDLIEGGFSSQAQAIGVCQNNIAGFRDIATHFNITCDNIASAHTVSIRSNDYFGQLYSMGRIPYGKTGETPVSVNGTTYWLRFLWSWDTLGYASTYQALEGTSSDGRTFFILYDCGNFVFIGLPPPPTPKCEWNSNLLKTDPNCFQPCPVSGKQNLPKSSPQCFEPCPVSGKQGIPASSPQCYEPCPYQGKQTIPKNSSQCFDPCPYNNAIAKSSPSCKPCEESQTNDDKTACLELSKKARNETQNIADANGTTAKGGDIISYTLSVRNKGKADIDKFVVQENISDVLDYADVLDLKGGSKDSYNVVTWAARRIKAGETITQQFTVKVKNPVPSTPVSTSDPGHFDLTMTNVYGNAVSIKLPQNLIKTTETITRTMPKTGPGTSLIAGFMLTAIVAYFFMRSRLMSKELELVRSEYNAGGSI